ncbi:MAG: ATP-binding cassette domain-containing protein [Candidatus Omnitrophica bacterium]|nr:ATP-binding cassette domain-containing protein [Candidatus Omnitrophota bacterium]
MDQTPKIQNASNALPLVGDIQTVEFDRVNFSYNPDTPVLEDVNFKVRAGDVIAFVGSSGSGKTTLVNLIPRFYDPVSGLIKVNGVDVKDLTLESLRSKIGYVTQETILFNDSVRDNIAYGRDNATLEEIQEAAIHAQAHDFISELPNGYDTIIGEKGVMLSGGQRQRLSIARAILKNPPILILDEATSALDTESEREVQYAIEYLMQNKTVFVIAHRLSTIQNATRILVLDQGRIVQIGSSQELLEEEGPYRRLYDLQFSV